MTISSISRTISKTFQMLTILTNTCATIPTVIFFAPIIFAFTVTCFIIPFCFELYAVLFNLHLKSHETCSVTA